MSRSRFTRLLIRASLGLGLVWACSATTTPARAGYDQLWSLGAKNSVADLQNANGTLPYNSSIMSLKLDVGPFLPGKLCMDAEGATAANGTPVIAYGCSVGENYNPWNQRWIASGGWCPGNTIWNYSGYRWQPPFGCNLWFSLAVGDNWGACVDVPGGNDANGQGLQIYECNGTPAQVWRPGLNAQGESPFWIRSNITGQGINRCMTNWGRVVLYDCAYDF